MSNGMQNLLDLVGAYQKKKAAASLALFAGGGVVSILAFVAGYLAK